MDPEVDHGDFLRPLFLGTFAAKYDRFQKSRGSLVHYTSCSALLSILEKKAVWLRNARCMNDFREMTYALSLIHDYFGNTENRKRFQAACDSCHPKTFEQFATLFDGHTNSIVNDSYIVCMSEHQPRETAGRLSMWRGYGALEVAAAVYLRTKGVWGEGPYGLVGYPCVYWGQREFAREIDTRITFMEAHRAAIKKLPASRFVNSLFGMLQVFCAAIKHPGFKEETEWRLLYLPKLYPSIGLDARRDIVPINGTPQTIYRVPLDGEPFNAGKAITVDTLVQRVVVGPCIEASVAVNAIAAALEKAGHRKATKAVSFCGIPYREKV